MKRRFLKTLSRFNKVFRAKKSKNQFLGLKTNFSSKKPDFRSKKSKNNREGGFLLGIWGKNEASKKRLAKKLE